MSQDEIVFEEIRYREPHRLRRLDRDRRWACLAYEVPAPDDLPIFLDRATADAIERHALRDTSVELGGILLGKECVDDQTGEPFVCVTKSLEAKHYENTQASFTYTHDSWEEITREREQKHPDLDIVGWYHTHPDFGVFLSSHDLFIHRNFFAQPLQVAYVVDPIRQTRGFFRWRDGRMDQVGGFYLWAERGDRVALARLVNDLENFPIPTEGGGGGLSPRLEAELIAMLTRPTMHHAGPVAVDRTQTALLFGLLGTMLGVLGLAAVLWLNHLNASVQDQAKVIAALDKSFQETADRQRLALDAVIGEPGGKSPERFMELYARTSRERDESLRKYNDQLLTTEMLAAKTKGLTDEVAKLKTQREELEKQVALYSKDAKDAPDLRTRLADLSSGGDRQARKIAELEELLDTASGRAAVSLSQKYHTAWYAALGGWVLSGLLALALVAGYAMLRLPPEDEEAEAPVPRPRDDQSPHRIE